MAGRVLNRQTPKPGGNAETSTDGRSLVLTTIRQPFHNGPAGFMTGTTYPEFPPHSRTNVAGGELHRQTGFRSLFQDRRSRQDRFPSGKP